MSLTPSLGLISRTLGAVQSTPGAARQFAVPQSPPLVERHIAEQVHRTVEMPLARHAEPQPASQPIPDGFDAVGTVMRAAEGGGGGGTPESGAASGSGADTGNSEAAKVDFEKMKYEMLATLRTELRIERERSRGWT
jgi:hypothetical protein